MSAKALYVVCYDTPSQKRRRRAVGLLSRHGRRVQESVFELLLNPTTLARIAQQLSDLLEPMEDNVLIYQVGFRRVALGIAPTGLNEQPKSQVI